MEITQTVFNLCYKYIHALALWVKLWKTVKLKIPGGFSYERMQM